MSEIKKSILVIDDDVQVLKMLQRMLERYGYKVITATDGKEGIQKYRTNPTDLVITDIVMENKEGIETIIELKTEFPNTKIVAMSGAGFDGPFLYLKAAKELGADRTLIKPIQQKELLNIVRELIGD